MAENTNDKPPLEAPTPQETPANDTEVHESTANEPEIDANQPEVPPNPEGEQSNQNADATATSEPKKECALKPPPTGEGDTNVNTGASTGEIDPCMQSMQTAAGGEATAVGPPEQDVAENKLPSKEPSTTQATKNLRRLPKYEKCVPDKQKVRPWYLARKKPLERRHNSSIAFVMPKQEDPEVIALRRTNKMVQKLIKYMKKSWKVRVDRKQADRELEHRTLASVYTSKPFDWMERIRAREERALETGFFSAMDIPYESLIDLELDTALLTFKNLPPDLKITAARWIRTRLRKEELKRKRDAFLPRLPHGKVKRPSYNKGRLIKDPGGVLKVDQFVKVGDGFHRVTKGSAAFSKVLKEWSQKKESESYNLNSGFGVIPQGMFDFSKGRSGSQNKSQEASNTNDAFGGRPNEDRRDSIVDGRKYQRDMLYFEKVMSSIYDIVKSLLNIKAKQLESKFPLPPAAVTQIRNRSPDRLERKKTVPTIVAQRKMLRKSGVVVGLEDDKTRISGSGTQPPPELNIRQSLAQFGSKSVRQSGVSLKARISKTAIENINAGEIINLSPVRSTTQLVDDIKKVHSYNDMLDTQSKKQLMTAEQKIKRLVENPELAAIRRARNFMTYTKLFERQNKKLKRPVWHDIDITAVTEFDPKGLAGKDPANLTEAEAAEVVQLALMKRKNLAKMEDDGPRRWPEEHDIPTPTFPFPRSAVKIPSEEESRLKLLKKTPHIDTVPSTPVRRLYKLAGIRTTEKDIFNNIMDMKRMFRVTENKIRVYYENEIGKLDWDTLKRFRCNLNGIKPSPVFQWTISMMRLNQEQPTDLATSDEDEKVEQKKMLQKRPALWYKKLQEEGEINGATRHNGCQHEYEKLLRYCDVDMKTKPHMLNRLALLVVSLPTTELGTKHWQEAIVFLLEFMFGTPPELIHQWLRYRGIPFLL